jgi:tetratricopeptide (TPR) repeat protein
VTQVARLAIDDEPDFTAAEKACDAGDWDTAVDGYQRTLKGTSRQWLKGWVAPRLLDAAGRAGRFDVATSAYVMLLLKDPSAAPKPPGLPAGQSEYLAVAATEVSKALDEPRLTDPQRQRLLGFLLSLHRARNDTGAAAKVAEQLAKLDPRSGSDPGTVRSVAELKLSLAGTALAQKDYRQALEQVRSNRALFTDPMMQADAAFCEAEALAGLAAASDEAGAWQDAAMAYMRVVAGFASLPSRPHVADSLLRTAQIHEKLGEPKAALRLYEQVAAEFADQAAVVAAARESTRRLQGSPDPRRDGGH